MLKLYVGVVVGGTRYLTEWFNTIRKLNPSETVIARDLSRSEPIPNLPVRLIDYDTHKRWESYEKRHLGWVSDESILHGIIKLLEDFIKTGCTHFLHIDSDVILSDKAIEITMSKEWDYLQYGIPVVPREASSDQANIMMFWESTNFGLSKTIATQILEPLKRISNPYPIDIRIHQTIKEQFKKLKNKKHLSIYNVGISHYINGVKVSL